MDGTVDNNWFGLWDNDLDIVIDDEAPDLFETGEATETHSFHLGNNGEGLIVIK